MNRRVPDYEPVSVKNLDKIREERPEGSSSRLSAMVLASFGGACIVFAALVLMRDPIQQEPQPVDPLGDLVDRSRAAPGDKPLPLDPNNVTFPDVLSDQQHPTTAMELVRGNKDLAEDQDPEGAEGPPPATDRLPVVPLPAQDMLHGSKAKVAPSDMLHNVAKELSREPIEETAPPGSPGGFQLQVSSFKEEADATSFAAALRRRGHRAHVEEANVQGRGLWYRVRIGPFKYKRSADIYRQDFEAKERMVTIVIAPPRTKVRIGLNDGD